MHIAIGTMCIVINHALCSVAIYNVACALNVYYSGMLY